MDRPPQEGPRGLPGREAGAATPLTYAIVNNLKRSERVDVYDEGTNFNPFAREGT